MYCYTCNTEKETSFFYESDRRNCKCCNQQRRREIKLNKELGIKTSSRRSAHYDKKLSEFIGPPEPKKQRQYRKTKEWYDNNPEKVRAHYKNKAPSLKKDREENPKKYMIIRAKSRAKEKDLEFNITEDDLHIPSHCPILGTELIPNCADRKYSMSIDRIDPSKGYIKGNVWVISNRANAMKNNADFAMLFKFAQWVFSITNLTYEQVVKIPNYTALP